MSKGTEKHREPFCNVNFKSMTNLQPEVDLSVQSSFECFTWASDRGSKVNVLGLKKTFELV